MAVAVSSGLVLCAGQMFVSLGASPPAAANPPPTPLEITLATYAGDTVSSTTSESATAGSDVTYQVTVSNTGTGSQTDLSVPVTLPPNFSLNVPTLSASAGTSSVGAGVIDWELSSLPPGGSATLTYTESADAPDAFESDWTSASVTSDQTETALVASKAVAVIPAADLSLSISDGVDSIDAGATDTYTATLTNNGPSEVPNATVTASFNEGFSAFDAESSLGDATFDDLGGGQFDWTGVDLPSGSSATFVLTGTVPSTLAAGDAFVGLAAVSPPAGMVDTDPVSTAADSDVVSGAGTSGPLDVAIASFSGDAVSSTPNESALAGTDITYQVTASNPTASAQTNVTVSVDPPPAFTLNSAFIASTGSTTTSGAGVRWSIGTLPGGSSETLAFTESTNAPPVLQEDATTASVASDQNAVPAMTTASVEVIPVSDLSVTVDDGMETISPSGTDTATITLTNNGPSAATNAMLTDTFSGSFAAMVAASSLAGTNFNQLGPSQFEWFDINLVSGAKASFTLTGAAASNLVAGSAFVDLASAALPAGEVDTAASSYAVDADSVVAAPQAVSFPAPTSGLVGQTVVLSATGGGSGNPVVFSVDPSSGADVCSVSGTNGATLH